MLYSYTYMATVGVNGLTWNTCHSKQQTLSCHVRYTTDLVVKNASGLLRGQYSKLLFVGLPQFGVNVDWINNAVTPRAAST